MGRQRGDGKGIVEREVVDRTGRKRKKLYTRVRWTGADGKRHASWREVQNRTDGNEVRKDLIKEMDARGPDSLRHARKTFVELATRYTERELIPAQYVDGRKIAGRRSLSGLDAQVAALTAAFGRRLVRSITYSDISALKLERLATPVTFRDKAGELIREKVYDKDGKWLKNKQGPIKQRPRSLATVHRELALLRSMLTMARREGWVLQHPFEMGPPLINTADERLRERTLTIEEETRLLAACTGPRLHLHALLIAALDTAMRQGQLFALCWRNVDFAAGTIVTDTHKGRRRAKRVEVQMTKRLHAALKHLAATKLSASPNASVFGITDNVTRSLKGACADAGIQYGGIDGFTFHCLRHTAITRMVGGGMTLAEAGRIAGHTSPVTTYRYAHATRTTQIKAAAILEAVQEVHTETEAVN